MRAGVGGGPSPVAFQTTALTVRVFRRAMPSLLRSLSARFRRSPPSQGDARRQDTAPKIDPRRQASCKVLLLDGTDLNVVVPVRCCGLF